eukprot:TRINITY_DN161962_c0_g1_i1.p1 TRINITY_DN161962_c0_g1~~TRINITY_DN161962_c0_g1_i1.p1  ORF type:complete len:260 (+),score=33.07 TRINITY_DN161962_c0_g1_i1:92-871(+)
MNIVLFGDVIESYGAAKELISSEISLESILHDWPSDLNRIRFANLDTFSLLISEAVSGEDQRSLDPDPFNEKKSLRNAPVVDKESILVLLDKIDVLTSFLCSVSGNDLCWNNIFDILDSLSMKSLKFEDKFNMIFLKGIAKILCKKDLWRILSTNNKSKAVSTIENILSIIPSDDIDDEIFAHLEDFAECVVKLYSNKTMKELPGIDDHSFVEDIPMLMDCCYDFLGFLLPIQAMLKSKNVSSFHKIFIKLKDMGHFLR